MKKYAGFLANLKIPSLMVSLLLLVGIVAWARPTEPPEILTIGVINPAPSTEALLVGYKAAMEQLGYLEGVNVQYLYEGPLPHDPSLLTLKARTLLAENVDLILSITTPATIALQKADTDIPIIFWSIQDPVAAGFVSSFQHPGGYMTGITVGIEGTPNEGRRLEWLKQMAPDIQYVYVPYDANSPLSQQSVATIREVAAELNIELLLRGARSPRETRDTITHIPEAADAIFSIEPVANPVFTPLYPELIDAAERLQLPISVPAKEYVDQGALMAFGIDYQAIGRQAARMSDQILRGTQVSEVPVEIPEFYLSVNLKTAEAIGLHIADDILQQANFIVR